MSVKTAPLSAPTNKVICNCGFSLQVNEVKGVRSKVPCSQFSEGLRDKDGTIFGANEMRSWQRRSRAGETGHRNGNTWKARDAFTLGAEVTV